MGSGRSSPASAAGAGAGPLAGGSQARCCHWAKPAEEAALLAESEMVDSRVDGTAEEAAERVETPLAVVQFSTEHYFCTEEEGVANVDVVRLGDASGPATFFYTTQDGSAKAGEKFAARAGVVQFAPRETMVPIKIPLLQRPGWDATLQFSLSIKWVRNAQRGQYLHHCRVSILDSDAFPTNKYRKDFGTEESIEKIPGGLLIVEYLKLCWGRPDLLYGTLKLILLDQVKNVYFLMTVYLQMYLVDVVLDGPEDHSGGGEEEDHAEGRRLLLRTIRAGAGALTRALAEEDELAPSGEPGAAAEARGDARGDELIVPGDRRLTAVVVGLLYIVPFVVNHVVDVWKISLGVGGGARKYLQGNLLRKFLNFKEQVRASISMGDLAMAMTRDIGEVVDCGLMKVISLFCALMKLCCALFFILSENRMAAVPLALFPIVGGGFLKWRERLVIKSCEEAAFRQNELVHTVSNTVDNYRLIADFHLRAYVVNNYEQAVTAFNAKAKESAVIKANTAYMPPWFTTILIGGFLVYGTYHVEALGGTMSLGTFFATISVFKEIGSELTEIYAHLMEMQTAIGPLQKLCFFLNQPTDLRQRMEMNESRRAEGKEKREEARHSWQSTHALDCHGGVATDSSGMPVFAVDTLNIEVKHVSFAYAATGPGLLKNVVASFPQGQLYAFVGPETQGKATLLRIIGQVLLPNSGDVFIPPHLRVLHLTRECHVLSESILLNLIFDGDVAMLGGLTRVRNICIRCGFNSDMLRMLDECSRQGGGAAPPPGATRLRATWAGSLSSTDAARLNLARALVLNPECLVMHMPLITFQDPEAARLLEVVRAHVEERGLEMPEAARKIRRPRTAFLTSSASNRCEEAHVIYEVSAQHGMRKLEP